MLLDHEIQALEFLSLGPDCIGVIDSDEKFAAACVFAGLQRKGLIVLDPSPEGPVAHILPAGRAALRQDEERGT